MSATNRGKDRNPFDFYATPAWCTEAILRELKLKPGFWLEPCAGNGAIIKAVNAHYGKYAPAWTAVELQKKFNKVLAPLVVQRHCPQDFLKYETFGYDLTITNPPYLLAEEMIVHALTLTPVVIMLLRLNFLGSQKRIPFWRSHRADVYVLPERPSFTGRGTDATEYAWFVWGLTQGGHLKVLEVPRMEK